jgi:hypothetical protein
MSRQRFAARPFAKQAVFILLCLSVPADNAAAANVLKLVIPAVLAEKPGPHWRTAQRIETNDAASAWNLKVVMDAAGNGMAVWGQSGGTWASRYATGTGWGNARRIETDNAGDASSAQVAMDSAGNAFAVWQQSDGTRTSIWANRYTPGSGWGNARRIETHADDASLPQVAADAAGNALAVWQQSDGTRISIWANRYE